MQNVFKKVNSVIIPNFKDYWVCPLINKYLPGSMNDFEGTLIIKKNGKLIFIAHPFNFDQAKKDFSKIKNLEVVTYDTGKDYTKILKKNCKGKTGFYGKYITYGTLTCIKKFLKGQKLIDVSKEIDESRIVKTEKEIKNIKIAVKETKKVITLAKKKLKKGISEDTIRKFIENKFEVDGFENSFCIVAFGKNTTNLHHVASKTKLKENDAVLFDVGCKYKGYCSDISESLFFGKKETAKFNEYNAHYKIIQKSIKQIENKIKPNLGASKLMDEINWDLPHALGHGIGLDVHDAPSGIGKKSKWKLKEGMTIAIEPGFYKGNIGIRIENNYLITKNGFVKL